ncbi:MAG TPA: biopolymer transporter TolR, partial [Hanamia sp.]
MNFKTSIIVKLSIISCCMILSANSFSQKLGIFQGQTDVGKVLHAGNASHDPNTDDYLVSGSGSNIWFTNDEFHFVWKKMKGDFILRTRGKFLGKGVEEHRKYGW